MRPIKNIYIYFEFTYISSNIPGNTQIAKLFLNGIFDVVGRNYFKRCHVSLALMTSLINSGAIQLLAKSLVI